MMTVYLVRHGEVVGNTPEDRAFAGWSDLPLTPRGHMQVQAVGECLASIQIDAVYASPLQRARLTAEGIAGPHGLQVQIEGGFKEVNYGDWEGLTEGVIMSQHLELWRSRVADPWSVAPPRGESYQTLWARLEPSWKKVIERHPNQSVVVVGHNGSLRVLLCHLLDAPFARARSFVIGNCSITKIHLEEGVDCSGQASAGKLEGPPLVIEYINNVCHLEGI